MACQLSVIILFVSVLHSSLGSSWNYKDHGPKTWAELGYSICEGKRQSPIDISNPVQTYRDCALEFKGYDAEATGTWQNNGHSFQFTLDTNTNKGSVAACDLKIFELAQAHFHWGSDASKGSEHTINGKPHSLEMHLVHKNIANDSDLLVVGILFDEKMSKHGPKELRPMKKLGRVFEEYLLTESSTDRSSSEKPTMTGSLVVDPFLEMGGVKRSHYEYLGSLTTPACSEVVTWIVATKQPTVPSAVMKSLRKMTTDDGEPLVNNFRPVQQLHRRQVLLVEQVDVEP